MCCLVRKGEECMGARLALVDTIVTEAPVTFVAHIASPVAMIRPDEATSAERPALEPVPWVVCRQRLSAICSSWRRRRRRVPTGCHHVWWCELSIRLLLSNFLPLGPCTITEAEPVLASLPSSVAVQTDIPLPIRADMTVVV